MIVYKCTSFYNQVSDVSEVPLRGGGSCADLRESNKIVVFVGRSPSV